MKKMFKPGLGFDESQKKWDKYWIRSYMIIIYNLSDH